MSLVQLSMSRNTRGQFVPGASGNPAGRPKGSRNRSTMIMEAIGDEAAEGLMRKAVDRAMAGDGPMLRAFLLKLMPPARRHIEITVEEGKEGDPRAMMESLL